MDTHREDSQRCLIQLREMLDTVSITAVRQQERSKAYSKQHHVSTDHPRQFDIGDKVLVFSPVVQGKRTEKLADRWQGPYSVLTKVTPVTSLIDMPERNRPCMSTP